MAKRAKCHLALDTSGSNKEIFALIAEDTNANHKHSSVRDQTFVLCKRIINLLGHLPEDPNVDVLVCLDSTIRVNTSSLYAGNRRIKKSTSTVYLTKAIRMIKERVPQAKIVVLKADDGRPCDEGDQVYREVFYRDFAADVMLFDRNSVSLRLLYTNYSAEDVHLRSRISQAESIIERLKFSDHGRSLITATKMHPVIAKIVYLWASMSSMLSTPLPTASVKRALFPILLFAASIQAFDKTTREVKEHGLKEIDDHFAVNCRLGETMKKALTSIEEWQTIDTPELGELGVVLKRLIVRFSERDEKEVSIQVFDLNHFRTLLSALIREHFNDLILSRVPDGAKTGTIVFHNSKHPQISWRVANSPPFAEIFPLISMLEKNGHRVLLFLPL